MGRFLRGVVAGAVLALVAAPVALADGLLTPSGALVYSWHGDRARGCATVGVCGIQGVLIVRLSPPAFLFSGAPGRSAQLGIDGATALVRVRRTDARSGGDCLDADAWPSTGQGTLQVTWRRDGRARLIIPSADGPSSGRCAGPLSDELGAILRGRVSGNKHPSFAFPARLSLAAGPYSATLVSTLRFRWSPDQGGFSSGAAGPPQGGRPKPILLEQATLGIRVTAAPATLSASFHGDADPGCVIFDACSTSGAVGLQLAGTRTLITLSAQRAVRRRVSRAQALADFRAGRMRVGFPLNGTAAILRTTETLHRVGGPTCADVRRRRLPLQVWVGSPFDVTTGTQVKVLIAAQDGVTALLRTHCPGPPGLDVFGSPQGNNSGSLMLAGGTIAVSDLLRRHSTVTVAARGAFAVPGYVGSRTGLVTLSLSLVSVSAGTIRVPGP